MNLRLPFEPLCVLYLLQQAGYEAYLVGGAVRDLLLNGMASLASESESKAIVDFDITTNASPEQIQIVFPDHFYENNFGTVSVTHDHLLAQLAAMGYAVPDFTLASTPPSASSKTRIIDAASITKLHISLQVPGEQGDAPSPARVAPFEITTYRSEGVYSDHRRPSEIAWGTTIEQDVQRRDFTINALALSVDQALLASYISQPLHTSYELTPGQYNLVDVYGGIKDLAGRILATVGDPQERFSEDALRMLRAVRIAVQLDFSVHPLTAQAIQSCAGLLAHISGERIRDELFKLLAGPNPKQGIELLDETHLLDFILPELLEGKNVAQGGHHTTDVWTHSLDALATCPSRDPLVRLATLIHDIGKPRTYAVQEQGITFYNHEIVGSRMAAQIGKRLRLSKQQQDRLFTLVRYHMFYYQPEHSDASIRRFMRKVGLDNIDDILALREGDRLGSGARQTSWRLEEMKQRMIDQLHQPMDASDLAINGHDLMATFALKPGPILGKVLGLLLEEVLDDPERNTKEQLLKRAKTLIAE